MQLLDAIDLDNEAKQQLDAYLPRFEFLLDDLPAVGDDQLRGRKMTPEATMALVALKIVPKNPEGVAKLQAWIDQLRAVLGRPGGGEALRALLTYIESVSEAPADDLHDLVASLGPDVEEDYVTIAEQLRSEGRAEGRAEALVEMLDVKFGPLPECVSEWVHEASLDQIRAWTALALTADALSEVFR